MISDYIKNTFDFKTCIIIILIISLMGISYYFKTSNDDNIKGFRVVLDQILEGQEHANLRGNLTLGGQNMIMETIQNDTQQTIKNQEEFFKPYLNESFGKIFDALNISKSK